MSKKVFCDICEQIVDRHDQEAIQLGLIIGSPWAHKRCVLRRIKANVDRTLSNYLELEREADKMSRRLGCDCSPKQLATFLEETPRVIAQMFYPDKAKPEDSHEKKFKSGEP